MVRPKVAGLGTTSGIFHSIKICFLRRFDTTFCHLILLQQTPEISYITDTCSLWREEVCSVFEADLNIQRCILKYIMPKCKHALLIITFLSSSRNYKGTSTSQKFLCQKLKLDLNNHLHTWPELENRWEIVTATVPQNIAFFAIVVNCGQSWNRKGCSSSIMHRANGNLLSTVLCLMLWD